MHGLCLTSCVISFPIFSCKNNSLCSLILKTCMSYHIICRNYEHTGIVSPFTSLCYSCSYLPIAVNKAEVSHIHRIKCCKIRWICVKKLCAPPCVSSTEMSPWGQTRLCSTSQSGCDPTAEHSRSRAAGAPGTGSAWSQHWRCPAGKILLIKLILC